MSYFFDYLKDYNNWVTIWIFVMTFIISLLFLFRKQKEITIEISGGKPIKSCQFVIPISIKFFEYLSQHEFKENSDPLFSDRGEIRFNFFNAYE